MKVRVSSKGQIVLPAEIRKKYGLEAGSELVLVEWSGTIHLVPVSDDPIGELRGLARGVPGFSSEEFLAERHRERDRDEEEAERWRR
jgi:AbrB family looped-hinge helix DNA binding protein